MSARDFGLLMVAAVLVGVGLVLVLVGTDVVVPAGAPVVVR